MGMCPGFSSPIHFWISSITSLYAMIFPSHDNSVPTFLDKVVEIRLVDLFMINGGISGGIRIVIWGSIWSSLKNGNLFMSPDKDAMGLKNMVKVGIAGA